LNYSNIERNPGYYTTGYEGKDPKKASFYLRSLVFDGDEGELTRRLIDEFNDNIKKESATKNYNLANEPVKIVPKKVIIINASFDKLPTSYETKRVFKHVSGKNRYDIDIVVVNTKEELMDQIDEFPDETLIISQCVDKKVYNLDLAKDFYNKNIVVIPGEFTAPGSIFSDKDKTYKLLSDEGNRWDMVARYKRIVVDDKNVRSTVDEILNIADEFESKFGIKQFFIKPTEGGGGLGGFRLIKTGTKYIIPDLSKVTGQVSNIKPVYVDIDLRNVYKIKELFWIYNLFKTDKKLAKAYINIDIKGNNRKEEFSNFKKYLDSSRSKQNQKLHKLGSNRDDTKKTLVLAIEKFEEKFNRRYIPLVNEHIDFGTWGLRAHFRLTQQGVKLETIYSRIFQLAFTSEGIGYVGSDNISNKQTGELEITRLGPINQIMLDAISGKASLFKVLSKASKIIDTLSSLGSNIEKTIVPFRIQLDLAAVSGLIGEVNADTARGLCLASSWDKFVKNTSEWFMDSLRYYSYRKTKKA